MPFTYTPSEILQIGDVVIYVAANYTEMRHKLFGQTRILPQPPVQIHFTTDALRWGIEGGAESAESLQEVANYAYWMYCRFQLDAQMILSNLGGGSVVPTPAALSEVPNPYDWIVTTFTTAAMPLKAGDSMVTLSLFRGFNIEFTRGGLTQNTSTFGDQTSYFQWNKNTGLFFIFPAAVENEIMRILPVGPGEGDVDEGSNTTYTQYIATGGETSIFISAIQNTSMVAVLAPTPYTIINSGTPTGLEALVTLNGDNLCDGNITFADTNPLAPDQVVTIIYSVPL